MARLLPTTFLPSDISLCRNPNLNLYGPSSSLRRMKIRAKIREIFMPALSSTMTEGKIVSWVKSEGDKLSKGESVVVVESDKADMDVETFYDGYLAAIMVEEGGVASVGSAIALLAETEADISEAKAKAAGMSPSDSTSESESAKEKAADSTAPPPKECVSAVSLTEDKAETEAGQVKRLVATPYAKKLAKEMKVDLNNVVGTGPMGRIVAKDVEAISMAGSSSAPTKKKAAAAAAQPSPVVGEVGEEVLPFTAMQAAVCRNMTDSLAAPTFKVGYTVITNAIDDLYKKIKSKGVTMTALLAKAAALSLKKHPVINSCCKDGKSFMYNNTINIAVAVAIDGGLITPVLRDADKVDIYTMSRTWKELVNKARAKKLQPDEYTAGTFTLSNLGMFGVDRFDAILPPGTGAIMAIGASRPTVVAFEQGHFGVRNQMQVNVTADHRIIYGADLASFLQLFAKIIEDPKELTL